MVSLEIIKTNIERILNAVSNSLNIEAAVFDSQCNLIACTRKYLERKGKSVHTLSLNEVLTNGNVLVNKPGFMPSCSGCRFKDHCPATIEILNSIEVNNEPIGVLSFTSFTQEGQKRLTKQINIYLDTLKEVSNLISEIAAHTINNQEDYDKNDIVQSIMNLSSDCFLSIDSTGNVVNHNAAALKLFPQCYTHSKSIYQILPKALADSILEGQSMSDKFINSDQISVFVSVLPMTVNGQFSGAIVRISQVGRLKTDKLDTGSEVSKSALDSIKGDSQAILNLKNKVNRIKNSSSTVLITGETGTGKELLAKAIHENSSRFGFPFISVNCASIPDSLFESELFGYAEGAFTGAKRGGKPGLFELANGGTLFLDEIGEMPLYMQTKLLRVLQDYIIMRVGGINPIPVDVRIIAATNRNIEEMIADKKFRIDLYYRLNVIPITIDPLHMRHDDIEILAKHFLRKCNIRSKKNINRLDENVIALLKSHRWPGNVRELENLIEYAVNMEDSSSITLGSLPDSFLMNNNLKTLEMKERVKSIELETIRAAIEKYGWDTKGKARAAAELGIGLRTLYRKIEVLKNARL